LPAYRDKWLAIGLNCDPLDYEAAKKDVADVYRAAGMTPPTKYYRFQSPLAAAIGAWFLHNFKKMVNTKGADEIRRRVGGDLGYEVSWQISQEVEERAWNGVGKVMDEGKRRLTARIMWQVAQHIRDEAWNRVADGIGREVWNQIYAQLYNSIHCPLVDQASEQMGREVMEQLYTRLNEEIRYQVTEQAEDEIGRDVWREVWSEIKHFTFLGLKDQIGDEVPSPVWWQLIGYPQEKISDQVLWQVVHELEEHIDQDVSPYLVQQIYGCHDAWWLAFYDYFDEVVGVECCRRLRPLMRLATHCGWWAPYESVAILQDRPKHIRFDADGRLHCDGGAAIAYRDGFSVWALSGTRVPQWLAETPAGRIDPQRIKEIDNAQVRAEFVRKVGLERLYHGLGGRVIDQKRVVLRTPHNANWECPYELVELSYGEGIKRRALKMPNPSMPELWHIEYVPGDVETVEQAMNFRLDRAEQDVDDESGQSWWLHGDVIIKPKGLRKWKRWPEVVA